MDDEEDVLKMIHTIKEMEENLAQQNTKIEEQKVQFDKHNPKNSQGLSLHAASSADSWDKVPAAGFDAR